MSEPGPRVRSWLWGSVSGSGSDALSVQFMVDVVLSSRPQGPPGTEGFPVRLTKMVFFFWTFHFLYYFCLDESPFVCRGNQVCQVPMERKDQRALEDLRGYRVSMDFPGSR